MKNTSMRIAAVIIAGCVAVGTAGILQSRETGALEQMFEKTALAGAGREEVLLASDKPSPDLELEAGASDAKTWDAETSDAGAPEAAASEAGASEADTPEAAAPDTEEAPASEKSSNPGTDEEAEDSARKLVFIYHSHNRESWIPELKEAGKKKPNEAFDGEINVTMLGARLSDKLEEAGIGALHSEKDYHSAVKNFNYNYSYSYSKTTVKEALAVHDGLKFLLDIHRDSARRESTTLDVGGKKYAKLYFIVGQGHANWKENEAVAKRIHEELEKMIPGLSKGILTKGTKHGHGEYNQSLSKGSVLVEVGGVDNTLEENYRTIDALATVIAKLVKESGEPGAV